MGERRSARRMTGVLTYEMGILVWDPEDEPAGPVGKVVNASNAEEERKNTTNLPVGNLDPKEDQTRH